MITAQISVTLSERVAEVCIALWGWLMEESTYYTRCACDISSYPVSNILARSVTLGTLSTADPPQSRTVGDDFKPQSQTLQL